MSDSNKIIKQMMQEIGQRARQAARAMARASSEQKNQALAQIAKLVREKSAEIQRVNQLDVARAGPMVRMLHLLIV